MKISFDKEKGVIKKADVKSQILLIIKEEDIPDIEFEKIWNNFLKLMEERDLDFTYGNRTNTCNAFRAFHGPLKIKKELKRKIIKAYVKICIWSCLNEFLDIHKNKPWNSASLSKFNGNTWSGGYLNNQIRNFFSQKKGDIGTLLQKIFSEEESDFLLKNYVKGRIKKKTEIVGQSELRVHTINIEEKDESGELKYKIIGTIEYNKASKIKGVWYQYEDGLSEFAYEDPALTFGKGDKFLQTADNKKLIVWVESDCNYEIINSKIIDLKRRAAE